MSTPRHAGFASVLSVGADLVDGMLAAAAALAPMPSFSLPAAMTIGPGPPHLLGSASGHLKLRTHPERFQFRELSEGLLDRIAIGTVGARNCCIKTVACLSQ
jgi:hypothetical protein